MKTIYIMLVLLALNACRSPKKTQTSATNSSIVQATANSQRSIYEWQSADSAGRYWYYTSDSTFVYHPDSGLIGRGGVLWGQEWEWSTDLFRSLQDTNAYSQQQVEISESAYQSVKHQSSNYTRWLIALLLGMIVAAVGWKRYKSG